MWTSSLYSQELPQSIWDQVESYIEDLDDEVDLSVLFDRLELLYAHPYDINQVSYDELQELRLLSEIQINDLLAHREQFGDLLMIEELQAIPSFNVVDINRIRLFFSVADTKRIPLSIDQMLLRSKQEVFLKWGQTLEDKAGFVSEEGEDPRYLGDKNKLQLRYRGNYEYKLRYGLIIEKDEGEQLFSDTIYKGLDYLTAHVYLKDYSTLFKDIALGDFSISMGQGLIAHNGFGAGKSAWVTDIKRGGRALRPYTSVTENGYHRGIGVTLRPRDRFELTLFGSQVNRDGNLQENTEDPDEPILFFSSLQTSGAHRTIGEKEDKGVAKLTSFGSIIKYLGPNYNIALNHSNSSLSQPIVRSDARYNLFRFSGRHLANTSIDYSWRIRNVHLFGESAYSSDGGTAHLSGALIGLDSKMSLALLYRNYGVGYNSINPNAFGESSLVNNESGFYLGLEFSPSNRWKIRTYADLWRHPWLRARIANPSSGKEYLVRVDYFIKRKLSVYVQYFYEDKLQNLRLDDPGAATKLNVGRQQQRHKLRIHFSNKVSKFLELRNRLEFTSFENPNGISKGYLLFQDVLYKPWNSPLSFTARFALFDTDDGNSRLYAYENSILYEFGIPTYSGRGMRYYINLRYKALRNTTLEFRIARTTKDRGNNGSGLEAIDGRTRTDIKAQIRHRF